VDSTPVLVRAHRYFPPELLQLLTPVLVLNSFPANA
jgi:hypothetical protein